ncbi:MAG: OmpA family protein [Proteobacteria bacterium]|nr:OmpA family protein [Pseudomonadota bacterium]
MKSFQKALLVTACVGMLAACSHSEEVQIDQAQEVDLTIPHNEFDNMDTAANYVSNSSVQVFSLDGAAAGGGPLGVAGPPPTGFGAREGGVTAGTDPSVTVFPFDDGMDARHQEQLGMMPPPMAPMASGREGFASPFGRGPMRGDRKAVVYFSHDSKTVTPASKEKLEQVTKDYGDQMLRVEGHASARAGAKDPVEKHMINLKVSMDRALNVSRELMHKGVPAERIETSAYGDVHPAPAQDGMTGEAASRRVEILTGR